VRLLVRLLEGTWRNDTGEFVLKRLNGFVLVE